MKRIAVMTMILGLVFIHSGDALAKRGWSSGGWGPGSVPPHAPKTPLAHPAPRSLAAALPRCARPRACRAVAADL